MQKPVSLRPDFALQQNLRESENQQEENWMVSYIDVFVLMTTIFVMIFVLSRQEISSVEREHTNMQNETSPEVELIEEIDASLFAHDDWSQSVERAIADHSLESFVKMRVESEFTELEVESSVLFQSGFAELTRPGESVLTKLLPVLKRTNGMIFIEGHTDNRPISTNEFPSNWELAAARANEVLKYYVSQDIDPLRLRAVSYGDTKPLVANDSELNRKKNRRVSIMIQTPKVVL